MSLSNLFYLNMHSNQYLISSEKALKALPNFRLEKFGTLNIYLESKTGFYKKSFQNMEVAFIGIFFDPLKPSLSGEKLLEDSIPGGTDINSFLKIIERFSGRYAALFRKNDSYYITGDFKHNKKILYSFQDRFYVITSSLRLYYELFNATPNYDKKLKAFFDSELFHSKQQDWYGNKTLDLNFKKLLPNHFLNIFSEEVKRIPFSQKKLSLEEVCEINYEILKGTHDYLAKNHKILQPITAGWDSRIVLGASLPHKDLIKYYIFKRPENAESSDIILSQKIAREMNLNFSVLEVEDFKDDFIHDYKLHNLNHSFISKAKNIQYHYHHHRHIENIVNVSGVSGNLLRNVFGSTKRTNIKKNELYNLNPYGPYSKITTDEIDLWYDDALDYAKSNNISLLDIFYIENRAANWGSIYTFEQDMALDEVDPFSNKSLMFPVFLLDPNYRSFGKENLSWKLLERFDKTLCNFPLNPHRSPLRIFFYKKYATNLLYKKMKFIQAKYLKRI